MRVFGLGGIYELVHVFMFGPREREMRSGRFMIGGGMASEAYDIHTHITNIRQKKKKSDTEFIKDSK